VDDKEESFLTLPMGCTGYLLKRRGVKVKKTPFVIPPDIKPYIKPIEGLDELAVGNGRLIQKV